MHKIYLYFFIFFVGSMGLWSCLEEVAIPIEGDFTYKTSELVVPTTVTIENNIAGAETYSWVFEGGQPSESNLRNPIVTYSKTGTYKLKLIATNTDGIKKTIEKSISIQDQLSAKIKYTLKGTNYAPVEVQFESEIKGTSKFEWQFENGIPSKSNEANPIVQYNKGGPHKVSLTIDNGFRKVIKDTTLVLEPDLSAQFSLEKESVLFENEVPITYQIKNESKGAISYKWTMIGADPVNSTLKNPVISYSQPGTYTIKLETTNGKLIKTSEIEIELAADKGYRNYQNLKLGIITAHDSLGSYFSTQLGEFFKGDEELTAIEGAAIDITFFGIDENFNFSQFVSPNKINEKGFESIIAATNTKFLNNQVLFTPQDFEQFDLTTVNLLPIKTTLEITKFIAKPLPQVVLFENAKGKKGAILVKEMVKMGALSYILVDIKVIK